MRHGGTSPPPGPGYRTAVLAEPATPPPVSNQAWWHRRTLVITDYVLDQLLPRLLRCYVGWTKVARTFAVWYGFWTAQFPGPLVHAKVITP